MNTDQVRDTYICYVQSPKGDELSLVTFCGAQCCLAGIPTSGYEYPLLATFTTIPYLSQKIVTLYGTLARLDYVEIRQLGMLVTKGGSEVRKGRLRRRHFHIYE